MHTATFSESLLIYPSNHLTRFHHHLHHINLIFGPLLQHPTTCAFFLIKHRRALPPTPSSIQGRKASRPPPLPRP
ncbi:hypothetical protein E2C01_077977 [Portunus trituberculatus]|uniref:Uncharacterized protein n=1 Tax=Portunus trituberculatus TaxID=210409 RepID=A0A5B7IFT2_PORTR|nr:hypothetical protein [Portunus trituberculatus]